MHTHTHMHCVRETASSYACVQVRANRLHLRETYEPDVYRKGRPTAPKKRLPTTTKPWTLASSIWAPRAVSGNSRDFFETGAAMWRMFENDWRIARACHGLDWFIVKCHHDAGMWRNIDRCADHEEVQQVKPMLTLTLTPTLPLALTPWGGPAGEAVANPNPNPNVTPSVHMHTCTCTR